MPGQTRTLGAVQQAARVFDLAREATRPGRTLREPAGLLPLVGAQLREPERARERLEPPPLRDDPERDAVERDPVERDDPDRDPVERERLPDAVAREVARERDRLPVDRLEPELELDRELEVDLELELELERERRGLARWSRGMSARTTSLTSRPISVSRYLAIRSSSRRMARAS